MTDLDRIFVAADRLLAAARMVEAAGGSSPVLRQVAELLQTVGGDVVPGMPLSRVERTAVELADVVIREVGL